MVLVHVRHRSNVVHYVHVGKHPRTVAGHSANSDFSARRMLDERSATFRGPADIRFGRPQWTAVFLRDASDDAGRKCIVGYIFN